MKKFLALILATLLAVPPALAGPVSSPTSSPTMSPTSSPTGGDTNPHLVLAYYPGRGNLVVGNGSLTDTRSTTKTVRDASGAWQTVAINTPSVSTYYDKPELTTDPGKTNYFLNSETPATQTTASLGTGTYCAWMGGSGSLAVSAGSATITGAGTATAGSPVAFTVTGAGTVVCTVSGSPSRAQLEQSPVPTAYTPTAGSATARAADDYRIPISAIAGGFPQTGTDVVAWRPKFAPADIPDGTNIHILRTVTSGSANLYIVRSGSSYILRAFDGTLTADVSFTWSANSLYYLAFQRNASGVTLNGLAAGKMRVGYSTSGTTWVWGTAANYDGALALGSYFYFGYQVGYPFNLRFAKIYRTVLAGTDLTRSVSDERAQVTPDFVPSLLADIRKTWNRIQEAAWSPAPGLAWGGAS